MKKDIEIPKVEKVTLAVEKKVTEANEQEWYVHLINRNDHQIENALVASKGYGEKNGEQQRTSTLRHFLEIVPPKSAALIEPIQPEVFHLTNEYWVSYYII